MDIGEIDSVFFCSPFCFEYLWIRCCYGYCWIYYVFFSFLFCFEYIRIWCCYGYCWIASVFFYFYFCFEYLWIRCILTWNVMLNVNVLIFDVILNWIVVLNVMVLMSVILVFQLSMFFRILDLLYNSRWFVCGNETGAIKETVSILPLLMQIMKTVLIGLVGNHVFV